MPGPAVPVPDVVAAITRAGAANPMLGIGVGDPGGGDPAPVTPAGAEHLIRALTAWLPVPDRRLAASLVLVGYAARLVGPAVAVLLREDVQLDLRAASVRHSFAPGRGFRLTMPEPAGWRATPGAFQDVVVDGHLRAVVEAVRGREPVATSVLWGDVASGLTGALRALAGQDELTPGEAVAAGEALLTGPLAGSGTLGTGPEGLRFVRRTCCLYYRLDRRATCGDCPLPVLAPTGR